jgi:hypothetical protein
MKMENILRTLYQERASLPSTLGVLLIEGTEHSDAITDTFDFILLIITDEENKNLFVKQYEAGNKKIGLHVVNKHQLKDWLMRGTNRKIFDWLFNGKIMFDRNDYLHSLIEELNDFPFHERKLRIGLEFAKLIRRYHDGRQFFEQKHYMDAFNHVTHSLHHLGRLALIEKGFHPEVTVWKQVKSIEPEIYKMYEELLYSEEPLNKRLELLFLVSDFFIHSKTELGASHILDTLRKKQRWSMQEILDHHELKIYGIDIFIVLEYLVQKEFLQISIEESKSKIINHRYYSIKS